MVEYIFTYISRKSRFLFFPFHKVLMYYIFHNKLSPTP